MPPRRGTHAPREAGPLRSAPNAPSSRQIQPWPQWGDRWLRIIKITLQHEGHLFGKILILIETYGKPATRSYPPDVRYLGKSDIRPC